MELTREADYGVRLMVEVAAAASGAPVTVAAAAHRQLVPVPFLSKIARRLVRAGLLRAGRGNGGLSLGRPAVQIDLMDIVGALEGPLKINRCVAGCGECPLEQVCPAHPVWRDIQVEVERRLHAACLADLASDLLRLRGGGRRQPAASAAAAAGT